jgi:hypothetical protein
VKLLSFGNVVKVGNDGWPKQTLAIKLCTSNERCYNDEEEAKNRFSIRAFVLQQGRLDR